MVLFSVLTPCYNADKWIKRCLDSITADNDGVDYEVLILDDGSSDDTLCICRDYAMRFSQFRVYTRANKGYCATMNELLRYATGEYVISVDSDNWLSPGALRNLAELIIQNGHPDIIQFPMVKRKNNGSSDAPVQKNLLDVVYSNRHEIEQACAQKEIIWIHSHGGKAIARHLFVDGVAFFGSPNGADTRVMEQVLYLASSVLVTHGPVLFVDIRPESLSHIEPATHYFTDMVNAEIQLIPFYKAHFNVTDRWAFPLYALFGWFAHSLLENNEFRQNRRTARILWHNRHLVFAPGLKNRIKQWVLCHCVYLSRFYLRHVARF